MARKIFDREVHGYPAACMNIHVENVKIPEEHDEFEIGFEHYYRDRYSGSDSD